MNTYCKRASSCVDKARLLTDAEGGEIQLRDLSVQPVCLECQHGDLSVYFKLCKGMTTKPYAWRQQGLALSSCVEHSAILDSSCILMQGG